MNFVQPIRDPRAIEKMKQHLLARSHRNYILFNVGINSGLRISDILPLRVHTVRGTHIDIIERKTKKRKRIIIRRQLRKELDQYIEGMADSDFLFESRNRKNGKRVAPITDSMAYKIIREAAQACGLENIGTHSMRKTFGYHFYLETKDIALLMDLFNHTEEKVTLRYIGIVQDTLDDALEDFEL